MAVEPKKTGPWKNMTAEERSAEMKRRRAVAKANGKHKKRPRKSTRKGRKEHEHASTQEGSLDHHVSYLFGKVETIIEYYSSSNGLPKQALAEGVASLLRH